MAISFNNFELISGTMGGLGQRDDWMDASRGMANPLVSNYPNSAAASTASTSTVGVGSYTIMSDLVNNPQFFSQPKVDIPLPIEVSSVYLVYKAEVEDDDIDGEPVLFGVCRDGTELITFRDRFSKLPPYDKLDLIVVNIYRWVLVSKVNGMTKYVLEARKKNIGEPI